MENQFSIRAVSGSRGVGHACHLAGRNGKSRQRLTTPEAIFLDRRAFLAGLARRARSSPGPGRRAGRRGRSFRRALSRQAQSGLQLDRDVTPEKFNLNYNNFYEFSTSKHIDAERAEDASLDGQARRPGREGADRRHRRADQDDGARGASLSPSLRRGLVDGDSLDRLPAAQAGRVRQAAVLGRRLCASRRFLDKKMAPGQRVLHALALYRGPDHGRGDQRSRLHRHRRLWQAARQGSGRADPAGDAVEIRLQVRQVDREASASSTSGRRRSGRRWGRTNMASGPTSIPTCRIRAGARRKETFLNDGQLRPTHDLQRLWRCRSPRSTRGWRKSRCSCERSRVPALGSISPALGRGDEKVAERLHARDVLHFLGIDEKAVHLRHVGLRQQAHEAGIRAART